MLIIGDIAVPSAKYASKLDNNLKKYPSIFRNQDLIINLEGLVIDDVLSNQKTPVLFNHSSVLPVLKKWNAKVLCLANNHTLDIPLYWGNTISKANENGLGYVGAGYTKQEAAKPIIYNSDGKDFIIFNQCWRVLLHHQKNPSNGVHVNEIQEIKLLKDVEAYGEEYPDAAIIVYFHWNGDLEILPFPVHRRIAMDLVDAGVNLVVGTHAHCVQGGEKYKDGYIIYGLGNFFVPWYTFIDGHISFPEFAKTEMVFEWNHGTNAAKVHFFQYEPGEDEHELKLLVSEDFETGTTLNKYSMYAGMSHEEYRNYFTRNRRKSFLIPVYSDYHSKMSNYLIDFYITRRMKFARLLAKWKLRGWNN